MSGLVTFCRVIVFILCTKLLASQVSPPSPQVVVVTAAYNAASWNVSEKAAVDNFMSSMLPVMIFGDSRSLALLQQKWPDRTNERLFIERPLQDFLSFKYLIEDHVNDNDVQSWLQHLSGKDIQWLLSIERYFMVAHAMYRFSAPKATPAKTANTHAVGYAWVDITALSTPSHVALAVGFPDATKVTAESVKLILPVVTSPVLKQHLGVVDVNSNGNSNAVLQSSAQSQQPFRWFSDKVMIAGSITWNAIRNVAFKLLQETGRNQSSSTSSFVSNRPVEIESMKFIDDWTRILTASSSNFNEFDASVFRHDDLKYQLFTAVLYQSTSDVCVLTSHRISLYEDVMEEDVYMLYHFGYGSPVSSTANGLVCK